MRNVLKGIVAAITAWQAACIMITHINKQIGKGIEAVDRILGSVAWASTARIALAFNLDPNDKSRFLCAGIKNNLGEKASTLAYRINKTDSLARVEWIGQADTTADEAMNAVKQKPVKQSLVEWLADRFREKGEWKCIELWGLAESAGFSDNAFFKSNLRAIISKWKGSDGAWVWTAKEGWPSTPRESTECSEPCYLNPDAATGFQGSDQGSGGGVEDRPRLDDSEGSVDSHGSYGGSFPAPEPCPPLVVGDKPPGWTPDDCDWTHMPGQGITGQPTGKETPS